MKTIKAKFNPDREPPMKCEDCGRKILIEDTGVCDDCFSALQDHIEETIYELEVLQQRHKELTGNRFVQPLRLDTNRIVVSVNKNVLVSKNAIRVLKLILHKAGLTRATITSGRRTSADQARIMYELIVRDGVSYAKNLYGPHGDQVIAVYEAQKEAQKYEGKTATAIKKAMEEKILEIGSQYVSRHCSDEYDVIDVSPSSIANRHSFRYALYIAIEHGIIDKFIAPPKDRAFHIEIKKGG